MLITYAIIRENRDEFLAIMDEVAQSRLRAGARRWNLYRDFTKPERIVEAYEVGSWREHLSQHEARNAE